MTILQAYSSSEKEIKDVFKSAPTSNPASGWTPDELKYYNIQIIRKENISQMIPLTKLTEKAENFLKRNASFNEGVCVTMTLTDIRNNKEQFQRKCFYNHLFSSEESRCDRVMEIFLNEILDLGFFEILAQHKINLVVKNQSHSTTPDFLAHYLPLNIFGMLCCEDKPANLSEKDQENAEAQAIAIGLAVCQQKGWKIGWPVFLFRCVSLRLTIYKAIFQQSILESVRNGHKGLEVTKVEKYFCEDEFHREGLYLVNPVEREKAAIILCSIENYFKN